ncbi:hypothetical protein C8Q78DRAFT_421056 [Trametes maxima]|nr:hypothetical protein C8Q78DRAFT_421056 [Trametes maxima]
MTADAPNFSRDHTIGTGIRPSLHDQLTPSFLFTLTDTGPQTTAPPWFRLQALPLLLPGASRWPTSVLTRYHDRPQAPPHRAMRPQDLPGALDRGAIALSRGSVQRPASATGSWTVVSWCASGPSADAAEHTPGQFGTLIRLFPFPSLPLPPPLPETTLLSSATPSCTHGPISRRASHRRRGRRHSHRPTRPQTYTLNRRQDPAQYHTHHGPRRSPLSPVWRPHLTASLSNPPSSRRQRQRDRANKLQTIADQRRRAQ